MPSYYSIHFGCRANQADAATIEGDLLRKGWTAAGDFSSADVVVVNSCTVTASADSELRQIVRRIHRQAPQTRILVTGCYAQRRPEEIAQLPGVEWVVGNSHKSEIGKLVADSCTPQLGAGSPVFIPLTRLIPSENSFPESSTTAAEIDVDLRSLGSIVPSASIASNYSQAKILVGDISAQRQFTAAPYFGNSLEDRTRPNLKIQDGCNNRCSFCIIPSVRGLSRSLPVSDVLAQIRALANAGYREVVLSGVNLGQYGRDQSRAREQAGIRRGNAVSPPLPHGLGFPHREAEGDGSDKQLEFVQLIRIILDETPIERLRLSSVEPMDFSDKLLDLMASTPRIARHIHAPLQSGSSRILRGMHRKYRAAQYRDRILAAYDRMPDAAFGADVIVGFPGETDADFDKTRSLIDELPFTYLHVFPFSRRPGTLADQMPAQVDGKVVRERGRILRELVAEKNLRFRERQLGRTMRVLTLSQSLMSKDGSDQGGTATDGLQTEGTRALTDNYLKVIIAGPRIPAKQWIDVRIISVSDGCLVGERESAVNAQPLLEEDPSMMTCASA